MEWHVAVITHTAWLHDTRILLLEKGRKKELWYMIQIIKGLIYKKGVFSLVSEKSSQLYNKYLWEWYLWSRFF